MTDLDQRIAALSPEKRELLLKRLNKQQGSGGPEPIAPRQRDGQPLPLSFAQESLWLVDQLAPESAPAYNVSLVLRLQGPLNQPALEQSLQALIARHESLRTTFPSVNGQPVQVIAPSLPVPLSVVDLQTLPPETREQRTNDHIRAELAHSFDLARGPLLHFTLLRQAEEHHLLLVLLYHIIADEWSLEIFLKEVPALYEAFSTNQSPSLLPLPIQYADYAFWQREQFQSGQLDSALAYWKQRLAGAPAILELPTDHPRPPVQTFHGATLDFVLSSALTERLQLLSRQEQASPYMTMLAAFHLLLARYTGREDIVVGSPIANRTRSETEGLIGYMLNMLALRSDLSGAPSFRTFLRQVRVTTLEAFAHQDFPISKLVEALQPERSPSYPPLFQMLFAWNQSLTTSFQAGELTWSTEDAPGITSKFDLHLSIRERSDQWSGSFEYNTDLFEAATIERMLSHFQTLLEGIVADPDQPITTLPLLPEAEQQHLLVEWNATQTPRPQPMCVHRLFEEQAEKSLDDVAVVFQQQQLTYRQLNERANQLAHYLRAHGVGPDVPVGLALPRSLEMVIGVLGILKAGGAYVPLDLTYPAQRLSYMLSNAQAPVLLTQASLVQQFPDTEATVICLDRDWPLIQHASSENLPEGTTPEHLAYVIYTSGSTGTPKGVAMGHRALCNLLLWQLQSNALPERVRTLQFAALSFDVAFQEIFTTWCSGGTLFLITEDTRRDFSQLLRFCQEQAIEAVFLPFVALRHLAEAAELVQDLPSSLRAVITAGEQLQITPALVKFFQRLDHCTLYNQYGPSESHVVTVFPLEGPPDTWPGLPPIGTPIDNVETYVLDAHLQPLPIGVPGELYLGGMCLARGYLHRPDLTQERFIPHPFSSQPGARLYKTGDLARWRADGNIEYIGRIDQQVKIRGYRIEPGEIESLLAQHPSVRQAAVLAREDTPGNKRLVAYVVAQPDQAPGIGEFRSFLQEHLPDYMIPAAFVSLDVLPLTPSGKVDRKALPAPDQSQRSEEESYVAPSLIEHYQLLAIWEDLLETRPIGIRDNFFFLGGHSLLATRMINRIQETFGKRIPLATLFAGPTIEDLTNALKKQSDEKGSRAPIYTVQTGGSKRPIFYLHGAYEGGGFYCYRLARDLGPDRPFYALEPYRLAGYQDAPTFEQMAQAHIEAMRAIQPEGPYLLGGFCNGGLFAAEMTRQLRAQGQEVDLLFLIDPTPPFPLVQSLGSKFFHGLGRLLRLSQATQLNAYLRFYRFYSYVREVTRRVLSTQYRKAASLFYGYPGLLPKLDWFKTPLEKYWEDWVLLFHWFAPGRVPVFEANRLEFIWTIDGEESIKAWAKVALENHTETYKIPYEHNEWTAERIQVVAGHVNASLNQVEDVPVSQEISMAH